MTITPAMRKALDAIATGAPFYVMPVTRRALLRAGLIAFVTGKVKSASPTNATNSHRFELTTEGRAALAGAAGLTTHQHDAKTSTEQRLPDLVFVYETCRCGSSRTGQRDTAYVPGKSNPTVYGAWRGGKS